MEAEGIAMRPGPRPVIAPGVLPTLRRAILSMQLVVVRYAGPDADEPNTRILCPYGILYGGRGWLVAHVDELSGMRLWRLDRIVSIDLLDRGFARCEDFDLAVYAAQSFGVFQEEPIDVVLRFEPEAANDAARWIFHPTQRFEREPSGSLIVRFRSGGLQEMCWHLFTWGTAVRVIEPQELRMKLTAMAGPAPIPAAGRCATRALRAPPSSACVDHKKRQGNVPWTFSLDPKSTNPRPHPL
jgi:predicted DNA-binding transcriptional regulator YafY